MVYLVMNVWRKFSNGGDVIVAEDRFNNVQRVVLPIG